MCWSFCAMFLCFTAGPFLLSHYLEPVTFVYREPFDCISQCKPISTSVLLLDGHALVFELCLWSSWTLHYCPTCRLPAFFVQFINQTRVLGTGLSPWHPAASRNFLLLLCRVKKTVISAELQFLTIRSGICDSNTTQYRHGVHIYRISFCLTALRINCSHFFHGCL